jgi:hypothetical protein
MTQETLKKLDRFFSIPNLCIALATALVIIFLSQKHYKDAIQLIVLFFIGWILGRLNNKKRKKDD